MVNQVVAEKVSKHTVVEFVLFASFALRLFFVAFRQVLYILGSVALRTRSLDPRLSVSANIAAVGKIAHECETIERDNPYEQETLLGSYSIFPQPCDVR